MSYPPKSAALVRHCHHREAAGSTRPGRRCRPATARATTAVVRWRQSTARSGPSGVFLPTVTSPARADARSSPRGVTAGSQRQRQR